MCMQKQANVKCREKRKTRRFLFEIKNLRTSHFGGKVPACLEPSPLSLSLFFCTASFQKIKRELFGGTLRFLEKNGRSNLGR